MDYVRTKRACLEERSLEVHDAVVRISSLGAVQGTFSVS
jgi:hypothetical protein